MNQSISKAFVAASMSDSSTIHGSADEAFRTINISMRSMLIRAVGEIFGREDPFAQFALEYHKTYMSALDTVRSKERRQALETSLKNMREIWEVIELDTCQLIDNASDVAR